MINSGFSRPLAISLFMHAAICSIVILVMSAGGKSFPVEPESHTESSYAACDFEFIDFALGDVKRFRLGTRTSVPGDEGEGEGLSGREGGTSGTNILSYNDAVKQLIERNKYYPVMAKKRRIEGEVVVSFTVGPDGQARSLVVKKTSGYDILDNAALDTVISSSPFPPPLEALGVSEILLTVPIVYKL